MKLAWGVGLLVCASLAGCITRRSVGGGGSSSSSGNSGSGGSNPIIGTTVGAGGMQAGATSGSLVTSTADSTTVGPSTTSGTSTASSSGSGPSACYDSSTALIAPGTKTVAKLKRCTSTQISAFLTACTGPNATQTTCQNYQSANGTCFNCLIPTSSNGNADLATPPLLSLDDGNGNSYLVVNEYACEAAAQNKASCGPTVSKMAFCQLTSCLTCQDAELDGCKSEAAADVCSSISVSATCAPILQVQNFSPQCAGADFNTKFTNVANYLCGM